MSTLLVASRGGHLSQLVRLAPRLPGGGEDVVWVTNEGIQSRSLLAGAEVIYVPYQEPRDAVGAMRNARRAWPILRSRRFGTVVSTGSGLALAFLPLAASLGIPTHYIESCARVSGPSLTGRLLARVPGVTCYRQHRGPDWPLSWAYGGSVLDAYSGTPDPEPATIRTAVVSLGTWGRGFRRLVERLIEVLEPGVETLWQTGATDVNGLDIPARPWVDPIELAAAMRRADLVVTHAGCGSALDALDAGKTPLTVPRSGAAGELVDEHQAELADELERRGLGVASTPAGLSSHLLHKAAGGRVAGRTPPPFELLGRRGKGQSE